MEDDKIIVQHPVAEDAEGQDDKPEDGRKAERAGGPRKNIKQNQGKQGNRKQGGGQGAGQGGGQGAGQGKKPGAKAAAPAVVQIRPVAASATVKRRHWGLVISFVLMVLLPVAASGIYLWGVSTDQYASTTGFTVRQEDGAGAADLMGGLAQFVGGGSAASDSDILYEFIQSQKIVEAIDERVDLVNIYSRHWENDPIFALWPDANIEDLLWYWQRVVRIAYDQGTGLIEVRVLAFTPKEAELVGREILAESQEMINALNAQARDDVMGYAEEDLETAISRLKVAREALTRFRTETQIVDPEADIQGRMGVLNNLQQQLAEALIDYDILLETSNEGDPRLTQALRRIEVIRERIADERQTFASQEASGGKDYPTLMAEFESLTVDREFAEESYRAALAALDAARAEVTRQSRYLAAYIRPTLPQSSEYPQRIVLFGLLGLFMVLFWAILTLIYYSIRDRR